MTGLIWAGYLLIGGVVEQRENGEEVGEAESDFLEGLADANQTSPIIVPAVMVFLAVAWLPITVFVYILRITKFRR